MTGTSNLLSSAFALLFLVFLGSLDLFDISNRVLTYHRGLQEEGKEERCNKRSREGRKMEGLKEQRTLFL